MKIFLINKLAHTEKFPDMKIVPTNSGNDGRNGNSWKLKKFKLFSHCLVAPRVFYSLLLLKYTWML